jgi:hypothetical protein
MLLQSMNLFSSDWKFMKKLNTGHVASMNCIDSNNCYVLIQQSGYVELYNSYNKGKTWTKTYKSDFMDTEPYLLNVTDCVSPRSDYYFMTFRERCYVIKSSDGGISFKKIKLSDSTLPYSIVMKDKNNGIILSEFVIDDSAYTFIFVTNDGWETFRKLDTTINGTMENVGGFSDDENIPMDYSSKISKNLPDNYVLTHQYINYNFKNNKWSVLNTFYIDSNFVDTNKVYHDSFDCIDIVNDSIAFLAGHRGSGVAQYRFDIIYRTKDGGKTWKKVLDSIYDPKWGLQDISFYDEKNGVAVGQLGKILTTNDGGDTWVYNVLPQNLITEEPLTMKVTWAGHTPIIGTWYGNIYRYEGNFFKFVKEPDRVNLISPSNNVTKLANKVELNWSDNGSTKYYLQITKIAELNQLILDTIVSTNNFEISNLESFTNYYWRVGTKYNKKMIWSVNYSFQTKLYPCSTISPECGSIGQNINPTLEWTKEKGADFVRLEYAKSPDFLENRILIDSIMTNNFFVKNLDSGTTYYWHVQAFNYAEASEWSETCDFTTNKTTGVNYENKKTDFIINPNPATDYIEISSLIPTLKRGVDEGSDIQIFDMLGTVVFYSKDNPTPSLPASREGVRIDVSFLTPGIYFIKVGNRVEKFVKM